MDDIPYTSTTISTVKRPVVCMIGTLRSLDLTHENLIQKVIEPLNADLIFCVTRLSEEDETLLNYFRDFNIVDVCIYEDAKHGYEALCEKFSDKLNLKNKNRWREYFNVKGNWLGGMQGRGGSGMHLTYNYWKLLERLQHLKTKGFDYQRFVITRTDLFWMVEHPPLKLLDPRFVWIPTGEDYSGYNDRHAICSKKNICQYLNSFEYMMNSRAFDYLFYLDYEHKHGINHEKHLKSHLDYCGVRVGRFKSLAYLTGSQTSLTNWASVKSELIDGKEYAYKYKEELLNSLRNSKDFENHKDYNRVILRASLFRETIRLLKIKARLLKAKVKCRYQDIYKALRQSKHT